MDDRVVLSMSSLDDRSTKEAERLEVECKVDLGRAIETLRFVPLYPSLRSRPSSI